MAGMIGGWCKAPPALGLKEVLIQIKAYGICSVDIHVYEGDKGAAEVNPPTILGHEFSGMIADIKYEMKIFPVNIDNHACLIMIINNMIYFSYQKAYGKINKEEADSRREDYQRSLRSE